MYEGNFQDREKMRMEKEIRLRYGRFFYRFPNGESAADVYDRITGTLRVISILCFLRFHQEVLTKTICGLLDNFSKLYSFIFMQY